MYIFKETNEDRIKTLTDDYNELKKKGENFKALKRKYSIYKIQKDYPNLQKLTTLFNSKLGKLYETNNNLKTIQLLKTVYDDPLTLKPIDVNLKFLRVDPNTDLDKIIKENDKTINDITSD